MASKKRVSKEDVLRRMMQQKREYVNLIAGSGVSVPELIKQAAAAQQEDGLGEWVADLGMSQRFCIYMALQVGLVTVAEALLDGKQN